MNERDESTRDELRTRRPQNGALFTALSAPDQNVAGLIGALIDGLDRGDGWVESVGAAATWHYSHLALVVAAEADVLPSPVVASIVAVEDADGSDELFQLLNDLNVHAAGWCWHWDPDRRAVICSARITAHASTWWWTTLLAEMLPFMATTALSMAPALAAVTGGTVPRRPHPRRGLRPDADSYVQGAVLQFRELAAGLQPWVSQYELARLDTTIEVLQPGRPREIDGPLGVRLLPGEQHPATVLREHFHPEYGWGWQVATLVDLEHDIDLPPRIVAVTLNGLQSAAPGKALGGWVHTPELGLVHQTFVPGLAAEKLLVQAGPTSGDLLGLLVLGLEEAALAGDLPSLRPRRLSENLFDELELVHLKTGALGGSYLSAAVAHGKASDEDRDWLAPRQLPVCTFGYFNPMGPTVSSLEVSATFVAGGFLGWTLHHVLRHPHSPSIRPLGEVANTHELADLVEAVLADPDSGVLGDAPECAQIYQFEEAVFAGLRAFARNVSEHFGPETDWRLEADALMHYRLDPWQRLTEGAPVPERLDWPAQSDDVDCWVEAVSDPVVALGQRAFMRSAWQGALTYRTSGWNPQAAQAAADSVSAAVQERLLIEADYLRASLG